MSFNRNPYQYDINSNLTNQPGGKRKARESYNLNPYNLKPNDSVSAVDGRKLEAYELAGIAAGLCNIPNTTQEDWENNFVWVYAPTNDDSEISYVALDVINTFQGFDSPQYYQEHRIIRKHEFAAELENISAKKSKTTQQMPYDTNTNNVENINNNNSNNNNNNNNSNENSLFSSSASTDQAQPNNDLCYRQGNEGFNNLIHNYLYVEKYQIRQSKMFDTNGNIVQPSDSISTTLKKIRAVCKPNTAGELNSYHPNHPEWQNWQLFIGQNTSDQLKISDYDLFVNFYLVLHTINFILLEEFCKNNTRLNSLLNNLEPAVIAKIIELIISPRRRGQNTGNTGVITLLNAIDNLNCLYALKPLLPLRSASSEIQIYPEKLKKSKILDEELEKALSERIKFLESRKDNSQIPTNVTQPLQTRAKRRKTLNKNTNPLPSNSESNGTQKVTRKRSAILTIGRLWREHPYHSDLQHYLHDNANFQTLVNLLFTTESFQIRPMMVSQNHKIFEADPEIISTLSIMRSQVKRHERHKVTGLPKDHPNWKLFTGQSIENQSMISDYDLFVNYYRVISAIQTNLLEDFTHYCPRLTKILNSLTTEQMIKLIFITIIDYKEKNFPVDQLKILLNSIDNLDLLKSVHILFTGPDKALKIILERISVLEANQRVSNQIALNSTQPIPEVYDSEPITISVIEHQPANDDQEEVIDNVITSTIEDENNLSPNQYSPHDNIEPNYDLSYLLYSGKVGVIQVSTAELLILPLQCKGYELQNAVINAYFMLTFKMEPRYNNNELAAYVFNCNIQEFSAFFPNVPIRKCFTKFEDTPIYYELQEDRIRISWFGNLQKEILNTLNANLTQGYSIQYEPNQNFVDLIKRNPNNPIDDIEQFLRNLLIVRESAASTSYNQSHLQSNTLWRSSSMTSPNITNPSNRFQP